MARAKIPTGLKPKHYSDHLTPQEVEDRQAIMIGELMNESCPRCDAPLVVTENNTHPKALAEFKGKMSTFKVLRYFDVLDTTGVVDSALTLSATCWHCGKGSSCMIRYSDAVDGGPLNA